MNFKEFMKSIEKKNMKQSFYNVLIVLLVGVLIILVSSFFKTKDTSSLATTKEDKNLTISSENVNSALSSYEQNQKNQLKSILASIEGVGRVEVMITIESTAEKVPAVDMNKSTSTTNEKDNVGGTRSNIQNNDGTKVVMQNSGSDNEPLILKVLNPKINGVVVVAEGGENKALAYKIIKTVSTLYNIPEHKVNVYSMKK